MSHTKSYTCSYVNLTDVLMDLNHGAITDDEIHEIYDFYFDWVSFGDATYTMIGNNIALDSLRRYWTDNGVDVESLTAQYWELVGENDYLNLENH